MAARESAFALFSKVSSRDAQEFHSYLFSQFKTWRKERNRIAYQFRKKYGRNGSETPKKIVRLEKEVELLRKELRIRNEITERKRERKGVDREQLAKKRTEDNDCRIRMEKIMDFERKKKCGSIKERNDVNREEEERKRKNREKRKKKKRAAREKKNKKKSKDERQKPTEAKIKERKQEPECVKREEVDGTHRRLSPETDTEGFDREECAKTKKGSS